MVVTTGELKFQLQKYKDPLHHIQRMVDKRNKAMSVTWLVCIIPV